MTTDAKPPSIPESPLTNGGSLPLHERIFYSGVFILVAGLIGAALIYVFSSDDAGRSAEMEFANPRAYEFQIERLGGKAAVYAVRFNAWFTSLWHGRQLAFTVAVLAIAIALGCFWVANRLSATLPSDRDQGGAE
jgi:hypothetical protein